MTTQLRTTRRSPVDVLADDIAGALLDMTLPRTRWTHEAHVLAAVSLVRRHGADEALRIFSRAIPAYNETTGTANTSTSGYHHTLTVFFVWAVDRLLQAGLSTTGVLWHPLVDRRSPGCWWDDATLWSTEARQGWVEPTLAAIGEPRPPAPATLAAA
jgi:hypothetical protein